MNRFNLRIRLRPHRAGGYASLLALPALLLWLAPPLRADVIDDFDGDKKYAVTAVGGVPDCAIVQGQLRMSRPRGDGYLGCYYLRTYALPEERPVEFRVDVVSANAANVYAALIVEFLGKPLPRWGQGYGLYRLHGRVVLAKSWEGGTCNFIDTTIRQVAAPVTLILTLTRQGDSLKLGTKVVRLDNQEVIFEQSATDNPRSDLMGDLGSPFFGPVVDVEVICGDLPGSNARDEVILDNLVCSDDPLPAHLGIHRIDANQAVIEWEGHTIPLEADSVQGPWRPCVEEVTASGAAYTATIQCNGAGQFFRAVPGWHVAESFDSLSEWATASPVPGRVWKPLLRVPAGHCRILGEGPRNEEFLLRFTQDVGLWYKDCVASVDIVGWDQTMVEAAFGILLRVKPDRELWFCSTEGLPAQHYGGLLTFKKADNPAESALSMVGPGDIRIGPTVRFPALSSDKSYRLRFWAVGRQLTLELFDLDDVEHPIQTCQTTDSRIAEGMDALYGTRSATGTYDVTIDRFLLWGMTRYLQSQSPVVADVSRRCYRDSASLTQEK